MYRVSEASESECSHLASNLAAAALKNELRGIMCVYVLANGEYEIGLAGRLNHEPALALGYACILKHSMLHRSCSDSTDCPYRHF